MKKFGKEDAEADLKIQNIEPKSVNIETQLQFVFKNVKNRPPLKFLSQQFSACPKKLSNVLLRNINTHCVLLISLFFFSNNNRHIQILMSEIWWRKKQRRRNKKDANIEPLNISLSLEPFSFNFLFQ